MQGIRSTGDNSRDIMVLKAERDQHVDPSGNKDLAGAGEARRRIMVRSQVEILDYGALPRTERKSKRVFNHRETMSSFLDRGNVS